MADLPDLDTSTAGLVAYYNVIDSGGATDLDPTDILNSPDILSYTQYDNGIVATAQVPLWYSPLVQTTSNTSQGSILNSRYDRSAVDDWVEITLRIKSDGWMVAVWPRDQTYDTDFKANVSDVTGYYTLMGTCLMADKYSNEYDTPNDKVRWSFGNSNAEWIFYQSIQEMSNSNEVSFNSADIGFYNYEFTSATTCSHAFEENYLRSEIVAFDGGLSYTSGTNRYYHSVSMSGVQGGDFYSGNGFPFTFGGVNVAVENTEDPNSPTGRGCRDVIGAGIMPSGDTVYSAAGEVDRSEGDGVMTMNHVIFHD